MVEVGFSLFPFLLYGGAVMIAVMMAQAFWPSEILQDAHHQRLYWTGVIAALALLGLFVNTIAA
ncbi:hypothetical protein OSH11_12710 [Kaistia dalseonensis]|uniref:Uncharacterized protein n=1 Tax=Kaistia dalseonensis TaxID=410840 RepID=A0ABU0H8I3_9HYPH|nr:hypothetical protein [Kaistia dalseonensis]MCX5495571.1 hypothetical protein [Kaistia dalseonensis]MDQ0438163.1 hypothetical protein [Kaistia dalseonensis]